MDLKRNRTNTNTSVASVGSASNASTPAKPRSKAPTVPSSAVGGGDGAVNKNKTSGDLDNIEDAFNLALFENPDFDVETYVKNVAAKSMFSSDLVKTKENLARASEKTAEEIKQNVYNHYGNFMETAKEVGHLEGKMSQLRQSLDEQKKLLTLFKNLNVNSASSATSSKNDDQSDQLSQQQQQQQQQLIGGIYQKRSNLDLKASSSLAMLLEEVEGCGVVTQKPGRELVFHSDLEALHQADFVVSHKLHAYLLSDALLLTLPLRKRNKNSVIKTTIINNLDNKHQYKFQAFYELQDISITNIEDRKEVRNAFQVNKFPESLIFRCANAHLKKEWLENIEHAKKKLDHGLVSSSTNTSSVGATGTSGVRKNENLNSFSKNKTILEEDESNASNNNLNVNMNLGDDFNRSRHFRDQFSDFDIYLAQRDFEKAVDLLIRIKTASSSSNGVGAHSNGSSNLDAMQLLVYKQKETELINMLRKDLNISKERGNKGIQKTGKRVVNCLVKLKIYDEALNLFIDYHKTLNSESIKKIKLEESNSIYMNNVMNLFFDNLKLSFISFKEAFQSIINYCLSTYINWIDTEIEIVIRKLESQHYIGRQFALTVENCELIFEKSLQFSQKNFEVKFLFETKLRSIIEESIKEQKKILIDASIQRSKFDDTHILTTQAQNEQNKQIQIQKFLADLEMRGLRKLQISDGDTSSISSNGPLSGKINGRTAANRTVSTSSTTKIEQTSEDNIFNFNLNTLNASAIQFSRGVLNFFCDILRIYYQDINYALVEALVEMFKLELKMYEKANKNLKDLEKQSPNSNNASTNAATPPNLNKYKKSIEINLNFIFDYVLPLIERIYEEKTKTKSKLLAKLHSRYSNYKGENFK